MYPAFGSRGFVGRIGLRAGPDIEELWRSFSSLHDVGARQAFIRTLRGIVDPGGQHVSATDRLYLARELPTLLLWGERDRIIPVQHGHEAKGRIPGSLFETFPGAGHFPHRDNPALFVRLLHEFIDSTEPADVDEEKMRELLRNGG